MDQKRVEERAKGRKVAQTITKLIEEETANFEHQSSIAFWDELGVWIDKNRPPLLPRPTKNKHFAPTPFTDAEARVFGQQRMWFGKYKGELCWNIPLTYFDHMVGKDRFFMDGNAARYLTNEKVAERLRLQIEGQNDS